MNSRSVAHIAAVLSALMLAACAQLVGYTGKSGAVVPADAGGPDAAAIPTVTWTLVGHPSDARRIAACSPTLLYKLTGGSDAGFYVNDAGGINTAWTFVASDDGVGTAAADSIACDGNVLVKLQYNKWTDYTFLATINWTYVGEPTQAMTIGGGPGIVTFLNQNSTEDSQAGQLLTSSGDDVNSFPGTQNQWTYRDTPIGAARVAGTAMTGTTSRFFKLDTDGSLSFDDDLLSAPPPNLDWSPLPGELPAGMALAGVAGMDGGGPTQGEITAGGLDTLFVLDVVNGNLWLATLRNFPQPPQ